MRKNQTLFTMALLVLLGSMGAAQAQNFAEVKLFTTPAEFAREGGKMEGGREHPPQYFCSDGDHGRCNNHAAFLRPPCGRYNRNRPDSCAGYYDNRGHGHSGGDGGER